MWERRQPKGECSPRELLVSDNGRAVIRTHGVRPTVVAFAPDGTEVARVVVIGDDPERPPREGEWPADSYCFTTAGDEWSGGGWACFFEHGGTEWLSWRTTGESRLLVDLTSGEFCDGSTADAGVVEAARATEAGEALALLRRLTAHVEAARAYFGRPWGDASDPPAELDGLWQLSPAIRIAGERGLAEAIPLLREWEPLDRPRYWTALRGAPGVRLEGDSLRAIVNHALRQLGEVPQGVPYTLTTRDDAPFPARQRPPGEPAHADALPAGATGEDALRLIGVPDHVGVRRGAGGEWGDAWDYDWLEGGRWATLRLLWGEPHTRPRLIAAGAVEPDWLHNGEREPEILR